MNINMTDKIEKKGMKKMSSKKTNLQNSNGEKSYYKSFMLYCIILLVGIFLPEKLGVHYLNFNFIYMIIVPLCIISFGYFKFFKKSSGASLCMSLFATFCITFTLYAIFNVLYTNKQKEYFFISNIEDVASSGYRSPSSIFFQLDNNWIALVIKNEYPIKKKIENGHEVKISGYYKKGLLSSVKIVDYTIY